MALLNFAPEPKESHTTGMSKIKSLFSSVQKKRLKIREGIANFMDLPTKDNIQEERQQSLIPSELKKIQASRAREQGLMQVGDTFVDPLFVGGMKRIASKAAGKVFHGTTKGAFGSIMKDGFNFNLAGKNDPGLIGRGVYFSKSRSVAGNYGDEVVEATIDPSAKLFKGDIADLYAQPEIQKAGTDTNKIADAITEFLRKRGFDGVESKNQISIFNSEKLIIPKDIESLIKPFKGSVFRGQIEGSGITSQGRESRLGNAPHITVNKGDASLYGNVTEYRFKPDSRVVEFSDDFGMQKTIFDDISSRKGKDYAGSKSMTDLIDEFAKDNSLDAIVTKKGDGSVFNTSKLELPKKTLNNQTKLFRTSDTPFSPNKVTDAGVSFTTDPKFDIGGKGRTKQTLFVDSKANILQFEDIPKEFIDSSRPDRLRPAFDQTYKSDAGNQAIVDYAKSKGFDGVNLSGFGEGEIRMFSGKFIKTPNSSIIKQTPIAIEDTIVDFESSLMRKAKDNSDLVPSGGDMHMTIGDKEYRVTVEDWFGGCLESRGVCATSKENIKNEYLGLMKKESNMRGDLHGYLPDVDGTDFGRSYIADLIK